CPDLPDDAELKGCPPNDRDRDGVKDKYDKCPDVPGAKSMNGCPDKDEDGITDVDDKCPDKAGPRSNNGCPLSDIDADGDGVPDKVDECPFIKGTVATNGCPDTDKDGITDAEDDCPYIKGDAAHYGCPDPNKSGKKPTIEKLSNINFETDRTIISIQYFETIEKALDLLSEDSTSMVILSGHTDSEGDARHNMNLSQNRADAVKNYLLTHGVNEDRISTVAYGETKPMAENSSPDNKFKNRRVEINIIREGKK
ncbi:MAG: OmpA family protein, partial [Chitinophagales bacterium]